MAVNIFMDVAFVSVGTWQKPGLVIRRLDSGSFSAI